MTAELDAVRGALALSAHVAVADPAQLGSQLVGRLIEVDAPGLLRLRATVAERAILWPLLPGLTAPGGPLLGTVRARQVPSANPMGGSTHVVVQSIAVLPDGRTMVVGYEDGEVHALDVESGFRLWARHHDVNVLSLAVDPHEGLIVSGAADGVVRLLDPATGNDLGSLGRHEREVRQVAVSPGGRLAVSGSLDGDLRFWSLDDRRETGRLHGSGPFAFAPDGRRLFAIVEGELRAFDVETRTGTLVVGEQRYVLAMAATPDGHRLVTIEHEAGASSDEPDRELNRVVLTVHDLRGIEAPVRGTYTEPAMGLYQFDWATLAIAGDSSFAVSGSLGGSALRWDLARVDRPARLTAHATQVLAVAVTRDARRVLTGSRDGTVRTWDPALAHVQPHVAAQPGEVNGIAVTPDGRRAITVASEGSIAVWDFYPVPAGRAVPWTAGPCWSTAISDDGGRAVVGGSDGLVVTLDLGSGAPATRHGLPDGHVLQVGYSATGRQVWAIATDGTRAGWDSDADTLIDAPAPTGGTPLFGLAATPDGARTLAGAPDGTVSAMERGHPEARHALGKHRTRVRSAALTQDGRFGLTGAGDGEIAVWDLDRSERLRSMAGHDGVVMALAVTPDGRLAASAGWDSQVALWDVTTGERLATFSAEGRLVSVALSANGSICVAGEQSGRVHALLVDVAAGRVEVVSSESTTSRESADLVVDPATARAAAKRFEQLLAGDPRNADHAQGLAIAYWTLASVLGAQDAAGSLGYAIRARDLLRGLRAGGTPLAPAALGLVGPIDEVLARAADSLGSKFDRVAIAPDSLHDNEPSGLVLVHGGGPVFAVAAMPDGRRVASAGADGAVRIWDLTTATALRTLRGHEGAVHAVAATPDGELVVSGSLDGTVRLWAATSGAEARVLRGHEDAVYAVAVTPDGKHALSGSGDGTVRVWDLASGSAVDAWRAHPAQVMALAVSEDGRSVVAGSGNGTLRTWHRDSGATRLLVGHAGPVLAVALAPGDDRAVSGSFDQTMRIWDLERGVTTATLGGHHDAIRAVRVTPDGRRLVSACFDGSIRIWDLEWCAEVATLAGHAEAVTALALLPGGRRLVSGSNDGTVRVWDLLLQ